MALKTPNIGLIKPSRGEYENTWDIPTNRNADLLDGVIADIQTEIVEARGTKSTIEERLAVSLNDDGTMKDQTEIVRARNSSVYGNATETDAYTLDDRIEQGDREVYNARRGLDTLSDAIASVQDDPAHNCVVSAPTGFLSFTGAVIKVDGSVTPVVANINGYRCTIRSLRSTTVSGASGTYYVYLERSATGETYLDRSGAGQNNGAISVDSDSGKLLKFVDSSQNFITSDVQPGDILEITSTGSTNKGQYVVESIEDSTTLFIKGVFVTAQSNLNYKLTNLTAPTLGVTSTAHARRWEREDDRIYIGRAVFDGTNVTSTTSYAVKGRFEEFYDISLVANAFTQTVDHNLGYLPKRVEFYASQASDYSEDLEPLSVSDMTSSTLSRSVIVKMSDMTLSVKNATSGVFYKSYDGVSYTSGHLLVVVER